MTRALIIPEYASSGGTLTFFLTLLDIHRYAKLDTAVLIPREQAFPHVLREIEAHGAQLFIGPNRGKLGSKNYVSFAHDIAFCGPAYAKFKPELVTVINGTPRMMLGALALPAPTVYIMQTYPLQPLRDGVRRLVQGMAAKRKNKIVTVSAFAARRIEQLMGLPFERTRVIYNSYRERNHDAAMMNGEIADLTSQDRALVVLNTSHVVAWKGPDCWIETARLVLKQHPNVTFRWLGIGDQLDEMRAKVSALGLHDRIVFAGYDSNVSKHLDEASVYFQPSRIENHSMAVADAMAHGLPCVVSNVGGMPEAVIDGETGFVCPDNDAAAFAERILELLDSPYLRSRMGVAGQRRARARFSESVQRHDYLETYKGVMSYE